MAEDDNFDVAYRGEMLNDGTMLITSEKDPTEFDIRKAEAEILEAYLERYNGNEKSRQYSVIENETLSNPTLTIEDINDVATNIRSDRSKVLRANEMIMQAITVDAYIGRAYECIHDNINTSFKLTYPEQLENDDPEVFDAVKDNIENFNKFVHIEDIIRSAISGAFAEGNYSTYLKLRKEGDNVVSAVIDHYPLTICYPSDYILDGEPILQFDIETLKGKLQKTYQKSRKTKKAIFFEKIKPEIEENYPDEVYKAYCDNEKYARLDDRYTGFVRVNNMDRKFGISPIFKALKAYVVLGNIEKADVADSKTRSKKVIFQKLRKEILGSNGERKGLAERELAHASAVAALNTNFCLYTAPAFVEDLSYVVDKSTNDKTQDMIKNYTSKLLTALGISFADSELSSYSTANISVEQLMRTINAIAEQFEKIIYKYYQVYLEACGLPPELAPTMKILGSELMGWKLRKEIATLAYSTLGVSRDTVFKYIGLDVKDEAEKRKLENTNGYNDIFCPRATNYNSAVPATTSDDEEDEEKTDSSKSKTTVTEQTEETEETKNGRPADEDGSAKQEFDKDYNEEVRESK